MPAYIILMRHKDTWKVSHELFYSINEANVRAEQYSRSGDTILIAEVTAIKGKCKYGATARIVEG